MSSSLSACFPEGSSNIREAFRNAEASRIVCGRCGSTEDKWDVLTMSAGQRRQPAEGVTKFISASKFCSGPKSRRGKFALSGRRRNAWKCSRVRKLPRATTNVQKNKSYVGLFISYVGLFISYVGLFISYVGLIKSYVGLFNSYVGDKIS